MASGSAFFLGLLVGPVAVFLAVAATVIGATSSGWGYVVGAVVTSAGLLTKRWRRWRGLTRVGLGLLLIVAGARLLFSDGKGLHTARLPDGGWRLVNRLVDERDGTLLAAHALLLSGRLPAADARDFVPALEGAFARLRDSEGQIATPAIATWLGLQSPESFDAVVIPPEGRDSSEVAVVMLHGYTGNFAVYCWEMARSARAISALTVCPSVGPAGDWWSRRGEETLEHTFAWLARRGVRRVYLGGLSNGGLGASVLVGRAAHPGLELRGLVLISGASSKAPPPRVPVLLVEGRRDSMMPARLMRDYAQRAGPLATYVEVDSGHFAFLDRYEACEKAISAWLEDRERHAVLPGASSGGSSAGPSGVRQPGSSGRRPEHRAGAS
ncbi:alpha/beta hydrolase [Vitiosangium sp. GDMCC 1.1324]|uniref:alpha/beta hydrolase n=1 Tax=Vitiosangium sp. (strain GDMCC 1.1324) TaxID=2138576 RepID=UPI001E2DA8B3|nr:alpha/beta hydrolase [Vitiosangium sp. GDMCC 1.1324]